MRTQMGNWPDFSSTCFFFFPNHFYLFFNDFSDIKAPLALILTWSGGGGRVGWVLIRAEVANPALHFFFSFYHPRVHVFMRNTCGSPGGVGGGGGKGISRNAFFFKDASVGWAWGSYALRTGAETGCLRDTTERAPPPSQRFENENKQTNNQKNKKKTQTFSFALYVLANKCSLAMNTSAHPSSMSTSCLCCAKHRNSAE